MHNIKLTLAYDGKNYLGWQKTRMGPSIEESLQTALEQIVQHPTPLQAASRTDAGVHAKGQIVQFLATQLPLDCKRLRHSLNQLLPKDIVVLQAEQAPLSFHPTLDCQGKEYRYFICLGPTQYPTQRFYSWHIPSVLNLNHIRQVIPLFIGTHNFAAFCNFKKNGHYTDYVRTVQIFELLELPEERLCFRICGNHFLYKMVRNLVGTLIDVGRGKIALSDLPQILSSEDRTQAGVTAPAHGLFLHEVFYNSPLKF